MSFLRSPYPQIDDMKYWELIERQRDGLINIMYADLNEGICTTKNCNEFARKCLCGNCNGVLLCQKCYRRHMHE